MPISNEEWTSGRTAKTTEALILSWLQSKKGAFNITEIRIGQGYDSQVKDVEGFISYLAEDWIIKTALEKLVNEGKVIARIIQTPTGNQTYYKAV